jgi:hypothetical protein
MKSRIGFSDFGVHGFAPLRVFCTDLQRFSASNSVQNTRNGLTRYNIPANRRLTRYDIPANRPHAGSARSKSVRYTRNARRGRPRAGNSPPDGRFTSIMRPWVGLPSHVDVPLPHYGRTPRGRAPRRIGPVHTRRSRADFAQAGATTHRFAKPGVPCMRRTSENGEPGRAGPHCGPPASQRMVLNRKYVRQAHISAQSHTGGNGGNPPFRGDRCAIGPAQVSHISYWEPFAARRMPVPAGRNNPTTP